MKLWRNWYWFMFMAAAFAGGIWAGFGLKPVPEKPADKVGPPLPVITHSADTGRLEARIAVLESQNRQLRQQLEATMRQEEMPVETVEMIPIEVESPEPPLDPAALELAQRIHSRMEMRREARLEQLNSFLNLTDEQKEQVRNLLATRDSLSRWTGRNTEDGFDMDAAFRGILNDQQFEDYIENTQEVILRQADMAASGGTDRISEMLGLEAEQQNAVYDALHVATQEALIAREQGIDIDYSENLRRKLQEVLSPEQWEQVGSMRFLDRWRPGMGGPGRRE